MSEFKIGDKVKILSTSAVSEQGGNEEVARRGQRARRRGGVPGVERTVGGDRGLMGGLS